MTTLHTFEGYPTDGAHPAAPLALGADGNFYGTTQTGGDSGLSCYPYGCGTVYRISPSGVLTILHSFCPQLNCEDGVQPGAGLVQGSDGIFYGTTLNGGTKGMGTVFKITPRGKESVLYNFCSGANCIDGAYPEGGLVQGTDENFYGTTTAGGPAGYGTVFEITPGGMHTTLHTFDPTDSWPTAGLILATDGNFYGTTEAGGRVNCITVFGCGTVFQITAKGNLTTLYRFGAPIGCPLGCHPYSGLSQATDGNFYGTTFQGGDRNCQSPYGCGTVFRLSTGLGPFVAFVRNAAKAGETFGILGQALAGTSEVSLNGTPAPFTVKSDTLIVATVPNGATTGYVTVTTPGGTLTSNVAFVVIP